jgi:hypothetical protein
MLLSRNVQRSTMGYSPSMLLFGETIRNPMDLDGNFNEYRDQESELAKTLYRLTVAEQFIADKKLNLFQESQRKYEERLKEIDFQAGQKVMLRRHDDERPAGVLKKGWIHYTGPRPVLKRGTTPS